MLPEVGFFFQKWFESTPQAWDSVRETTLQQLFETCLDTLDPSDQLMSDLKSVESTLWSADKMTWLGELPGGWRKVPSTNHYHIVNDAYPGRVFVFCSTASTNARQVPGAFFLRALAARHIEQAIKDHTLAHVCIPKMSLIALSPCSQIESLHEDEQPYEFVLVIDTQAMDIQVGTVESLLNEEMCQNIAQLCSLGFPISAPGWTHEGKLVVVPSPLTCFLLNEPEKHTNQYRHTNKLKLERAVTQLTLARMYLSNTGFSGVPRQFCQIFETALYEVEKNNLSQLSTW